MGYVLTALGIGGGSGAAAGAGAGAATAGTAAGTATGSSLASTIAASELGGSSAAGLAAPVASGLGESTALSLGIGKVAAEQSQAASSGSKSPVAFNDPPSDLITKDTTATTLQHFNKPSFLDELGTFGKDFGLEVARSLVQNSLSQVPGGKTIGSYVGRMFDSPAIKGLFSNQNDELKKRDDIIQILLKQRLGKA